MKIAIVGAGVSGLVAARLLHASHDITLFEAGDYLGGHANAMEVEAYGKRHTIDTGFMVFNERTYPNFVRLLQRLGVAWQASDMSFSVRVERTGREYNGTSLNTLFAQRSNLLRPRFWKMLSEILRFNREAKSFAALHGGQHPEGTRPLNEESVAEFLLSRKFGKRLIDHYILPMASAIWSCPADDILKFPAVFLARFFENHGLLDVRNRPQWFTVVGSSRTYVEALSAPYRQSVRLGTRVERIEREATGLTVTSNNQAEKFDAVILATHSDTALSLLSNPSTEERNILSAIRYQPNEAIVHTDARLLPRRKLAWASWNAHVFDDSTGPAAVTYYLNRLQRLDAAGPICVTLGNADQINPKLILRRIQYLHPVFSREGMKAQARLAEINGRNRTYFCGARRASIAFATAFGWRISTWRSCRTWLGRGD
jgi:predicted NAD/FAD-binding protein